MSGIAGRATRLIPVAMLAAACNTAPVLPPEDERVFELPRTSLWSGGELAVVVRHAEGEQPIPAVTLDGAALVVTRVDDTTFSAALPVHTGELAVRVEGEGIPALAGSVELHGFLSAVTGPSVAGAVVVRPGPLGNVLGAVVGGVVEVSLETGAIVQSWSHEVHALECSNGIAPGPDAATVLLRPRTAGGDCLPYTIRQYGVAGLLAGGAQEIWQAPEHGLAAIVGPTTFVVPREGHFALLHECEPVPKWTDCGGGSVGEPAIHSHVQGWVVGYEARRIVSLGYRAGLHNTATGEVVSVLPAGADGDVWLLGAVFSESQDTLLIVGSDAGLGGTTGVVQLHDAATGELLGSVPVPDGVPVAAAFEPSSSRILVLIGKGEATWLRVLTPQLAFEIDLPIPVDPSALPPHFYGYRSLLVDPLRSEAILVSTNHTLPGTTPTMVRPMQIHRWTLAPE